MPAEGLGKNRSFSLTSHQLRALTQLACTLLSFERTVRELVKNMSFVDFTEDTPCIKGTIQFHKKTHMVHIRLLITLGSFLIFLPLLFFDLHGCVYCTHNIETILDYSILDTILNIQ